MASFTSSSEVLMRILLLVGGIALMMYGAEGDLVSETCKQTLYSQVCESSLRSDPQSEISDLRGLAAIALNLSIAHAVHTLSYINNLKSEAAGNETDFLISGCLSDCVEEYSDAIQNLQDSKQSLNDKSYDTMNSLVTAAMTDSDTCEDGFKELTGYESPLTERNQYFSKLCGNLLLFSTLLV
ncbi:hypothetical protein FNV43_RR18027 [Rhamnella rubrinervis]|uniref:Pectinesterase inhibitor domain-containing protein n=1 Tax=Rhamnella rubrinervis TaxID=2594499 RepID=A0A8K0GVC8_9ROSA|nr:hypothetical protein FNV43_RR18027 [Rhamnella rubrinervis]